jgi:hypothetical protein
VSRATELANERYPIVEACDYAGLAVGEGYTGKLWCPFGQLFHSDGGYSKAFRIYYATNSAYCFACKALYLPVRLVAMTDDTTDEEAANKILETLGLSDKTWEERWAELQEVGPQLPDLDALASALNRSCHRLSPNWDTEQVETNVSVAYARCLGLLGKVRTADDAETWLKGTTIVMARALGAE